MKKVFALTIVAAALTACSSPDFSDATLKGLQTSCSAGDMTACSELAHLVKAQ